MHAMCVTLEPCLSLNMNDVQTSQLSFALYVQICKRLVLIQHDVWLKVWR